MKALSRTELERSLRQLQLLLAERERLLIEAEGRIIERERDIAEAEALLHAREKLVAASAKRRYVVILPPYTESTGAPSVSRKSS